MGLCRLCRILDEYDSTFKLGTWGTVYTHRANAKRSLAVHSLFRPQECRKCRRSALTQIKLASFGKSETFLSYYDQQGIYGGVDEMWQAIRQSRNLYGRWGVLDHKFIVCTFCSCLQSLADHQSESIVRLVLRERDVSDRAILALTHVSTLSFLDIRCGYLTDISLGYLKVTFANNITSAFQLMPNLNHLHLLNSANFTEAGFRSFFDLKDGARQLKCFYIHKSESFNDACIGMLTEW